MASDATTIVLPWPPSLNKMWRTPRSGRLAGMTILSAAAREYRTAAIQAIGPREPTMARVSVVLTLNAPTKRPFDIDNRAKAPLDALTHAGFWRDDGQVDKLTIIRGTTGKPGSAVVTIEEMSNEGS